MRNIEATGQIYGERMTIKQVSKPKAMKLFCEGKTIYLQSCNMQPFGIWQSVCPVKFDNIELLSNIELYQWHKKQNFDCSVIPEMEEPTKESQFKYRVLDYSWYNCDSERGKYVTFYANINDLNK